MWVVYANYDGNNGFITRSPFFKDISFKLNGTFGGNFDGEQIYILNSCNDYQNFINIINQITTSLGLTLNYNFKGFGTYPLTSFDGTTADLPISTSEYQFLVNYYTEINKGDVIKASLFITQWAFINAQNLSPTDYFIIGQAKTRVYTPGQQVLYLQKLENELF